MLLLQRWTLDFERGSQLQERMTCFRNCSSKRMTKCMYYKCVVWEMRAKPALVWEKAYSMYTYLV